MVQQDNKGRELNKLTLELGAKQAEINKQIARAAKLESIVYELCILLDCEPHDVIKQVKELLDDR